MIDKSNTLDKNFIQKIIDQDLDTNKWEAVYFAGGRKLRLKMGA